MLQQAFDELSGSLTEPMFLVAATGIIRCANPPACTMLQRRIDEVRGQAIGDMLADPPERLAEYFRQCRRSRQSLPGRLTWRIDGQPRPMRCDGAAIRGDDGIYAVLRLRPISESVTRFTELNRHIERLTREVRRRRIIEERLHEQNLELAAMNEELQAADEELRQQNESLASANEELQAVEEELRQQNAELAEANLRAENERHRYRELFDFAPEGYIVSDANGMIIEANVAATRLLDRSASQLIGAPLAEFLSGIDWDQMNQRLQQQERDSQIAGEWELEIRPRSGDPFPASLSVSIMHDAVGHQLGYRWLIRDNSAQKQYEAQLRVARDAAEAASRAKDHFLAVISHELRTPLTPVLLAASALRQDSSLPPAFRDDLAMIHQNIELEVRLIDDLLDLTRIQRGKFDLRRQDVELHPLLRQCLRILADEVTAKALTIVTNLDGSDDRVNGDPARLQQIFWNVLRNAVKFTAPDGQIELRTSNDGDSVCIEVRDTGIGIDPATIPRIFEAFEQGDGAARRAVGGLGLGLSISRALTQMHGGTISASSDGPGCGSLFVIRLPLRRAAGAAPAPPAEPESLQPHRPLRILLVEDHVSTAKVMSRLLARMGHQVVTVGNVRDALDRANACRPDLLISDLGLPDGSGLDIMRELRDRLAVPGIALSGFGMEHDKLQSLEAGFAAHLTKPADLHKLEALIRRIGQSPIASEPNDQPMPPG